MNVYSLLKDIPHISYDTVNPNKLRIPKHKLRFVEEDIKSFNKIYKFIRKEGYRKVEPTPSGGVPCNAWTRNFCWYCVIIGVHSVEFVFKCAIGQFRIIIGAAKDVKTGISGQEAYYTFRKICEEEGVDLDKLAIENGKEVKTTIPSPKIDVDKVVIASGHMGKGNNYYNCHHMDINSAFMAGIAAKYEDLRKPIERIYKERKSDKSGRYKAILTHAYGYFQSKYCVINGHGYALAQLSKAAIEYTNAVIDATARWLKENGRMPVLYNTDGIWYCGDYIQHPIEGDGLGGIKHDYVDCVLNIKSKGAYQFEGTDTKTGERVFKPVFRGVSSYEKVKPREEWTWDDIYNGCLMTYKFDESEGILYAEGDDD